MLIPLRIPPGVYRNGTAYQASGRWYDANLVRWFEGTIRPVGGWRKASATQMDGVARGMLAWRDNSFNRWCAIGTAGKLYIYNGGSIYDITPVGLTVGRTDSFAGVGFGFGPYGGGVYGARPNVTSIIDATTWCFDNWGQYLVACSAADGKIYQWELATDTAAAVLSNAPTSCAALIVSAERYLIALGAGGDPRRVSWSDQEDNNTWTPTATNTAGGLNLQTNGRLRCARRVRGQIILWTDTDIHALNYLGPPFIYGTERVGGFCGIVSPNAMAVIETGAAWMSQNAFYRFDGAMHDIPCDVSDYVFSDFNLVQAAKVYAGLNTRFGEVTWFYCSAASDEVDRYVTWNYKEGHWAIGSLARSSWADAGVFPYPQAVSPDGYIYEHENGWTADGVAIGATRRLKSGPVEIGSGDRVFSINQIVPDEKTAGQISLQFSTQFTPEGDQYDYGPFTLEPYTDVRFTGRQIATEIVGAADADWRLGQIRFNAVQGGRR